ncbi:MAG: hypothetical protein IPK07_15720 [Deltaproteobacteria bacterium]|nr:hypothetical protein [Deltaproteobacteria bacterium]
MLGAPSESVAGGGVYNDGELTLRRAAVSGNAALGGGVRSGGGATGGGVFSSATATLALDGCEVTGNQAKGGDGSGYCCTDENPCHCFRVGNGGPASGGGIASAGAFGGASVVTANAADGRQRGPTTWGWTFGFAGGADGGGGSRFSAVRPAWRT